MKVLDLFAGLGGWSNPFREAGHDVRTLDYDPRFDVDYCEDILTWDPASLPWRPDLILASPDCTGFTVMNIGKNWTGPDDDPPHTPKTDSARMALRLVERTRELIEILQPRFFIIENPVDKLRKLPVVLDLERRTVHYCHVGETNMKPTDLWGVFPPSLELPGLCHTRKDDHPEDCCCRDHASAPRGSRTPGSVQGVTGKDADAVRSEIPEQLARLVMAAVERDLSPPPEPVRRNDTVLAERHDDLIVFKTDTHLAKQVPSARYHAHPHDHADGEHWVLPLSWGSCVALRGVVGQRLEIGPELRAWAKAWKDERVTPMLALRDRTEMDGLGFAIDGLKPFQEVGAAFMAQAQHAIVADPMGAGKTIEAIAALRVTKAIPALVVCPASMLWTWPEEFERWWPEVNVAVISGTAAQRRKIIAAGADVFIINWEGLRAHTKLVGYWSVVAVSDAEKVPKELNEIEWAAVIADEAHRAKDPTAKQTRALWAVSADAQYRFALTGTPILNSPVDLWSLGHFVSPQEFGNKVAWIDRYCVKDYNFFGGMDVTGIKPEMQDELFTWVDPILIRRPKEAILPQLPSKTYVRRLVDLPTKQRTVYDEMRREMLAELDSGTTYVTNPLAKLIRLRQLAAAYAEVDGQTIKLADPSCKIDGLEEIIEEMGGSPGRKDSPATQPRSVVVFAESRQLIELAGARLERRGYDVGYLTGKTAQVDRKPLIDRFQAGKIRILLATLGAGGEGITLTAADTVVFLQRSFSQAKNLQAEDRIHRMGQEADSVTVIDIVARNTVEIGIEHVLKTKARVSEEVVRDRASLRRLLAGSRGATDEEAGIATGLDKIPSCNFWHRNSDLRQIKVIRFNGETRIGRTGRAQQVSEWTPPEEREEPTGKIWRRRKVDYETSIAAAEDDPERFESQMKKLEAYYRELWEADR